MISSTLVMCDGKYAISSGIGIAIALWKKKVCVMIESLDERVELDLNELI